MNRNSRNGYVGLLTLLLVCCITILLAWRSDLFSSGTRSSINTPPVVQGMNDIKAAQEVRKQIENQHAEQIKGLVN